jgi:hypothetical protein
MAVRPEDLEDAIILVGITRMKPDGGYTQEQHCGVASIGTQENGIQVVQIACDDGESREYPFDARTLQPAPPGEYRLRSSGHVIIDPHFLMTWTSEGRLNS